MILETSRDAPFAISRDLKTTFFFRLFEVVELGLFDGQKASRNKRKASTMVLIHGEFDSVHGLPPGPRGHAELTPFLAV